MTRSFDAKVEAFRQKRRECKASRDELLTEIGDAIVARLLALYEQVSSAEKDRYHGFGYWLLYSTKDKKKKFFFETDSELTELRRILFEIGGYDHASGAVNQAFKRAKYPSVKVDMHVTKTESY